MSDIAVLKRRKPAAAMAAPIKRPSLHDEVVGTLRDMIVEDALTPGSRVPERALCESLGVSRTPLREALKVLASEGLVELRPNRGAVVRVFTSKEAKDMLDLMGVLEGFAGELACARASERDLAAVQRLHERMLRHFARRERHEYFQLNQEIHSLIVRIADNASLSQAHAVLRARMRRIRYIGNESPEQWRQAVAEHEEILKALLARDAPALSAALKRHLANTWQRVALVIEAEADAEGAARPRGKTGHQPPRRRS